MGTGCVKERYWHPNYARPKVSCIVFLSSSVRRSLSYQVKPNRSNIIKRTTFLISRMCLTYKRIILNIKRKQNRFFLLFLKYWPSSHDFNKLVIKAKMHAKTFFFKKYNMIF